MNEKAVLCNKCGKSCCKPIDNDPPNIQCNYGLINASFTAGYFSDKFDDLDRITFSICEECLFKLFLTFKIMPEAKEVDVHDNDRGEVRRLKLILEKLK